MHEIKIEFGANKDGVFDILVYEDGKFVYGNDGIGLLVLMARLQEIFGVVSQMMAHQYVLSTHTGSGEIIEAQP